MEELVSINKDIIKMLQKYHWIYNFQVTRFFIEEPWKYIPEKWEGCLLKLNLEELNGIPFGYMKESWPNSLKNFVLVANKLALSRNIMDTLQPLSLDKSLKLGMSPKKEHEVRNLAALVNELAGKTGSRVIIDVGSGLGYLGLVLCKLYGLSVIGLESRQCHTGGADRRLTDKGSEGSFDRIQNITFELQDSSDNLKHFEGLIRSYSKNTDSKQRRQKHFVRNGIDEHSDDFKMQDSTRNDRVLNSNFPLDDCTVCEQQICQSSVESAQISNVSLCPVNAPNSGSSSTKGSPRVQNIANDSTESERRIMECVQPIQQIKGKQISPLQDSSNEQGQTKFLMVGLHCCGDLTPTMLKHFSNLDDVRGLCCVSCCYHRMKADDTGFRNFPMSDTVREIIDAEGVWKPSVQCLRLAAQETRARWKTQTAEDHDFHVRSVAFRAILEVYAQEENIEFKKLFRKIAGRSDLVDFDTYTQNTFVRCDVDTFKGSNKREVFKRLKELYEEYKDKFKYIEVITVLQVMVQPLIERLIYNDRQLWLMERGYQTDTIPIFDEFVSPRNLALYSLK